MADTPLLVVFPRGQLTELDKARMDEAGIIAVEADDPKAVQQLHLTAPPVNTAINGDAIVAAALHAIADHGNCGAFYGQDSNPMPRLVRESHPRGVEVVGTAGMAELEYCSWLVRLRTDSYAEWFLTNASGVEGRKP